MRTPSQYVYVFGASKTEGDATMKNLLGGKGANLAEMAMLGLPDRRGSRSPPRPASTTTPTASSTRPSSPPRSPPA